MFSSISTTITLLLVIHMPTSVLRDLLSEGWSMRHGHRRHRPGPEDPMKLDDPTFFWCNVGPPNILFVGS